MRLCEEEEAKHFTWDEGSATFLILENDRALDVGCGPTTKKEPSHFGRADVLVDINEELIEYYKDKNVTFIQAPVEHLPFEDKEFEFVWCSHLLEHVEDPKIACAELMRVGNRGRIKAPAPVKEILWPQSYHKWLVSSIGNQLVFERKYGFLYSDIWNRVIWTEGMIELRKNGMRDLDVPVYARETIFDWEDKFEVIIRL